MRYNKTKMERLQFYLEPELKNALFQLAKRERVSLGEIIRRSLRRTVAENSSTKSRALSIIGMVSIDPTIATARNHDKVIYSN